MKNARETKPVKEDPQTPAVAPAGVATQVPGEGKYDFVLIFEICGGIFGVIFLVWLVFSAFLHLF